MKMFRWKPGMVRFMRDASEYGSYHQKLAELFRPRLQSDWCLCDAGCGLGYLSLALAPCVRKVTAVDISSEALQVLRENCQTRDVNNIVIQQDDILTMETQRQYDGMVFCCFGDIEDILAAGKRLCCGTVFAVMPDEKKHRFSPGATAREQNPFQRACVSLRERQIPFEASTLSLEFGQPFHCLTDARRFFELYRREEDRTPLTDDVLMRRLRETGERAYPLYLPYPKPLGFLTFETQDIPV